MTTIEKIGQFTIAQHGAIYLVIDRAAGGHEVFTNAKSARDAALSRCDVVDFFEASAAIRAAATRWVN
jgi:hypothetical protein